MKRFALLLVMVTLVLCGCSIEQHVVHVFSDDSSTPYSYQDSSNTWGQSESNPWGGNSSQNSTPESSQPAYTGDPRSEAASLIPYFNNKYLLIQLTNEELADALGWHYDLEKVCIPVFIIAGTAGEFEIETVIPFEKLSDMYEKLDVPKAMARRTGAEHANTVTDADGYVTTWFMWQLQGDMETAEAYRQQP